jgi:hypothetical protein
MLTNDERRMTAKRDENPAPNPLLVTDQIRHSSLVIRPFVPHLHLRRRYKCSCFKT